MVVLLRFYSTEVMSCNALESINHDGGECRSGSMSVPTEDPIEVKAEVTETLIMS